MEEEDDCITMLCCFPNSGDNPIVAIGSATKSTLKSEDVVAFVLLEKMRRKFMEGVPRMPYL
jgi:hypothetical protein